MDWARHINDAGIAEPTIVLIVIRSIPFLMIVTNRDFFRPLIRPDEAYAPLIVDTDRVLAFSISEKGLKAISWRHTKVSKSFCGVQLQELAERDPGNVPVTSRSFRNPQLFRFAIGERQNHGSTKQF
jgi:hypothetical protein